MKKRIMALAAVILLLTAFSCQKKDAISCLPAKSDAKREVVTALRNGDGPYVLNMVVQLSGDNEVPMVNSPTKGLAHLRLTSDKKLYSKVIIQKLQEGDALRFAHIHSGAVGVNGPIQIFLCHTAADFGENIVTELTDAQYNLLLNDAVYVNALSNFFPPGIARGQVR